jgi:hypothetical protein
MMSIGRARYATLTQPRNGFRELIAMYGVYAADSPWYLAVVLAAGLASAVLARVSEGSCLQTWCQRLFVACLAIVGAATFASLGLGRDCCLMCGATLAVMSVAAVWDPHGGRDRRGSVEGIV